MADEHRRVEAQDGIVGSGMLTDPERIQALEAEKARRERATRGRPAKGFSSVLTETPASAQERLDVYVPRDERLNAREDDDEASGEGTDGESAEGEGASSSESSDAKQAADPALPRVPPDPRMAALHQQFARPSAPPAAARSKKPSKKRARRTKERK